MMNTEQRFRAKIAPANADGCELWTASTSRDGYGRFWDGDRLVNAHRFAWTRANGPIPEGLCVLHRCDVRACCADAHLFLGTNADNMADRDAKGRGVRGSKVGGAKLTEAKVVEVFLATGTQKTIAARLGISKQQVSRIKSRTRWAHATEGIAA